MKKIIWWLCLILMIPVFFSNAVFFVQNSWAQADSAGDSELTEEDELEGFGDEKFEEGTNVFEEIEVKLPVPVSVESKGYSYGGFFREEWAYSFQEQDPNLNFVRKGPELSKVRSIVNAYLEQDLSENWKLKVSGNAFYDAYYSVKDRDLYPYETLRVLESEAEFRDTFIEGPLTDFLWLKIGRQIIAWGESEGPAITDIANPRDNREMGVVDIEDARIPVFATKFSFLKEGWEFNVVFIHEFRANKIGAKGSDYDPYISIRKNFDIETEKFPESHLSNTEFLYRLFKSFNGGDISVTYADVFEDDAYLDFDKRSFRLIPRYRRIQAHGVAGNYVVGSWLLKFEFARKNGLAFVRDDIAKQLQNKEDHPESWSEKNVTQGMIGFDYNGVTDLTTTFEIGGIRINDYEHNLSNDEIRASPSLILMYDAWNNTLHPKFFWVRLPNDNGDLFRFTVDYDYVDALQLSAGVIVYDASKKEDLLYSFRNNDQILASLKYSF
ncbi:MAG: hypothetical protein HQM14_06090 [SAR324 cluster bacterium]|nr:hypothetical protein [SAR324 cluster bacterium]